MAEKMKLYRRTGVQVVWQIFPDQQEVHVYSGPNLEHMTVCSEDKPCSAAPVLPALVFPAKAVFAKEEEV